MADNAQIDSKNSGLPRWVMVLFILIVAFFAWFFFKILIYILVSAVLSIIGQPLVDFFQSLRWKKISFPRGLAAFFTLIFMLGIAAGFFKVIIPMLANQAGFLYSLDIELISDALNEPLQKFDQFFRSFKIIGNDETISSRLLKEFVSITTFDRFSKLFSSVFNLVTEVVVALLSVSFITYFFLREKHLFSSMVLFFTPKPYKEEAQLILYESKVLLRRYLSGLVIDLSCVFVLISACMMVFGLENALTIGFFAGILNVIPYVGPIIATFIGVFLGVSVNIEMDFYTQMLPLILKIVGVFIVVNTIDISVLQPYIFAGSIRSHPLEIFLIFIVAGTIGGVFGMIVAIPAYTVIRIIAKQFLTRSEFIKKLRAQWQI